MKNQRIKSVMIVTTVMSICLFAAGCGNTKPETASEKEESQVVVAETETEEVIEGAEPTESTESIEPETEEPDSEEEIIATGYVHLVEGSITLKDYPTQMEYNGDEEIVRSGTKVGIIEEYYCEEQQKFYYRVCLENGKKGYISKKYIQLEE